LEHDQQLTNYRQEWAERFERDSDRNGSCHMLLRYLSSAFPNTALNFPGTDAACVFRVKLLPLYVAVSSPAFVLSDPPARLVRCSYANYARLVMFSFGFQKAFQRGFEPDDEVFFTRVRNILRHIVSAEIDANRRFQRAWKAPRLSSRYSSILWFRRVTYVSRQTVCKPHATLLSFSTPHRLFRIRRIRLGFHAQGS
jgi:hypothetical protein